MKTISSKWSTCNTKESGLSPTEISSLSASDTKKKKDTTLPPNHAVFLNRKSKE